MTKKTILVLLMTLCLAEPVAAQGKTVIVLLDLSGSTAHITSASFAAKAGAYVAREVAGLPLGSQVSLRTFGLADATVNGLALDYTLTKLRGTKPREVAAKLASSGRRAQAGRQRQAQGPGPDPDHPRLARPLKPGQGPQRPADHHQRHARIQPGRQLLPSGRLQLRWVASAARRALGRCPSFGHWLRLWPQDRRPEPPLAGALVPLV